MKRIHSLAVCALLACAGRAASPYHGLIYRTAAAPGASSNSPAPLLAPPPGSGAAPVAWCIRAFPQARVSVALPVRGAELDAKDLGQLQALVAVGVRVSEWQGATYILLVYPISNPLQGASLEQRLLMLPYLLNDLGPNAARAPVDLDGLHGVEFVTKTDSWIQRARVFATSLSVIALIVRSTDSNRTTNDDARLFFDSLQWYDES